MTLISITGRTSGHSYGREAEAYTTSLDRLFDVIERGKPSGEKARKRMLTEVDSILDAAGDPQPVTASMRKGMKAVRLEGDKARSGLAATTDSFWKRYRTRHPKPAARKDERQIGVIIDPALAKTLRKRRS